MKINKIYKRAMGVMLAALAFIGCSDEWNEHYAVPANAQGNLWEAISSTPELSNFASVIKACGYDAILEGKQMFTIFAPTNDNFTSAEANSLIAAYQQEKSANVKDKDNSIIKEFLQNHIALYNYSVSSVSNDSIIMMNGKYQRLTSQTFGGENIVDSNKLYGNGVLFTLDNKVAYFPNIFEYLRKDADLDSMANFLYSYNKYEFDETASVPGDIINGKTVYLDSVINLQNELFKVLGSINDEDSTYWMVVPTNDVWKAHMDEYRQYFQYDNSVNKRDSLTNTNAALGLLRGTVFSRTRNTDASIQDSAMSVNALHYLRRLDAYGSYEDKYYQYDKPFMAGGVFNGTVNTKASNGLVMKSSDWNIDKTQTFFQTIRVEGENSERLDSVESLSTEAPLSLVNVQSKNPFYGKLSGNAFATIRPTGASSNTMAVFNIPNILSNAGYDIYIVTVPALAGDTLASVTERLPTIFRARLGYSDENGTPMPLRNSITLQSSIRTTADAVDTFKVATNVKVPFCSVGTTSPLVKIILDTRVSNAQVRNGQFNRILRLDCIIFKPHED